MLVHYYLNAVETNFNNVIVTIEYIVLFVQSGGLWIKILKELEYW